METCLAADIRDPYRGHAGPLVLERGPATSPLFGAFFEAVQQAGFPLTDDVNGYRQEGFAPFDRNIHNGRRLSAARAYLHPVMDRPNLEVKTRAFVTRILFEGKRAVGVEYARGRGDDGDRAGRRGRPVRRRDQLAPAAAALRRRQRGRARGARHRRRARPARASARTCRTTSRSTSSTRRASPCPWRPYMKWRNRPRVGLEWLLFKSGPGATNHFEAGGFLRSNEDVEWPNLMFHFLPIAVRYDGSVPGRRTTATRCTSAR